MPNPQEPTDVQERFIDYLHFVSDMLGGDILPIDAQSKEIGSLVSHRAIDYALIRCIVLEVQKHNAIFHKNERIQAFPTLDALGKIRGKLLQERGDIHQISLLDRIGELTVGYFNLPMEPVSAIEQPKGASIHTIK